jgi:hypothetical protein
MAFNREQVFVAVPTGSSATNNRVLVYDPRYQWWTLYDIPAAAMASFRVSTQPDLMFAYASGTNDVGRHAPGQTTDAGAAITSRWRSGWWDMGDPHVKTVRRTVAWGKGRLRLGLRSDFGGGLSVSTVDFQAGTDLWADGTNAADKWADGTNPADVWATAGSSRRRSTARRSAAPCSASTSRTRTRRRGRCTGWRSGCGPIESNRPY